MPYGTALAATLLIEVPVYLAALVLGGLARWPRAVAIGVGLNLATHPFAWLLLSTPTLDWPRFVAVECGVWLVETALLLAARRVAVVRRQAFVRGDAALVAVAALAANTGSCLAGVGMSQFAW